MDRRFAVAPMMDCTDRHDRYLLRLVTRRALLYTEMLTTAALVHGDRARLLAHSAVEHPLALQLGGNDPAEMARCAKAAETGGFDEVNINVGCPSERVRAGCFGAALMAEPDTVARCVGAMRDAVSIPVTVKTRIGIDERDSYAHLTDFVGTVAAGGCQVFIVHARKAWLRGLSPRENREIPPLRYDVVARLKRDFPALTIVVNGGVTTLASALEHLQVVDGVMMGREAYRNPYLLAGVDEAVFGEPREHRLRPTREEVVRAYLPYVARQLALGVPLGRMTRHMVGLYHGAPGARRWRRQLSEQAHRAGAGVEVIEAALAAVAAPAALGADFGAGGEPTRSAA